MNTCNIHILNSLEKVRLAVSTVSFKIIHGGPVVAYVLSESSKPDFERRCISVVQDLLQYLVVGMKEFHLITSKAAQIVEENVQVHARVERKDSVRKHIGEGLSHISAADYRMPGRVALCYVTAPQKIWPCNRSSAFYGSVRNSQQSTNKFAYHETVEDRNRVVPGQLAEPAAIDFTCVLRFPHWRNVGVTGTTTPHTSRTAD